jgi:putative ABC transport system substrate-binding protein
LAGKQRKRLIWVALGKSAIQIFYGVIVVSLAFSLGAFAQTPVKLPVIAMLITGTPVGTETNRASFRRALADLGYVEGRHYAVEERFAEGVASRLPQLVEELVKLQPDIILTSSTASTLAARNATSSIPIVAPLMGNAVGVGLIASQARPGGNITGILVTDEDLAAKQLALTRELVPSAQRIGLLVNPKNPGTDVQRKGAEAAATALSITLVIAEADTSEAIELAFGQLAQSGVGAVFVVGDALFFSERARIASAALSARLPTMFGFRDHVKAGGLMSYGVDLTANYRRAAVFADRILKGTKPSDLPVELPTTFDLALNLKTAKALGLTIPPSVLVLANEVIE